MRIEEHGRSSARLGSLCFIMSISMNETKPTTKPSVRNGHAEPPAPHTLQSDPDDDTDLDATLHIVNTMPLRWDATRETLYFLLAICTLSFSALFAYWFPVYAATRRYARCSTYDDTDFIFVTSLSGQHEIVPVERKAVVSEAESTDAFSRYLYKSDKTIPIADRMFVFRHMRYSFDSNGHRRRIRSPRGMSANGLKQIVQHGLSYAASQSLLLTLGQNIITVVIPSIPTLLFKEVLHPFFIFQIYSVGLWIIEQYYYFAGCIFIIAVVSIWMTVMEVRRQLFALSLLAKYETNVNVCRDGVWEHITSIEVVPGDIVEVTTGTVPCDVGLVSGSVVVNESMLTGESLPIIKSPFDYEQADDKTFINFNRDGHTVFSATSVMQLKPSTENGKVLGIVLRTGYHTTKGALILSILYPAPSSFKFVEQSYKFVLTLFFMSLVGFAISVWQLSRADAPVGTIILRGLDLITIVVPPSLPLALSVGTNFAMMALRASKIFCISPARINMAGKVRLMCFDKTGTLTSEGMELMGVLPSIKTRFTQFESVIVSGISASPHAIDSSLPHASDDGMEDTFRMIDDSDSGKSRTKSGKTLIASSDSYGDSDGDEHDDNGLASGESTPMLHVNADLLSAMSACHGLAVHSGTLIGDPLEVKIFLATRAHLRDTGDLHGHAAVVTLPKLHASNVQASVSGTEIGIKYHFEFLAALARMSVVAVNLSTRVISAYVKGAPEVIEQCCLPSTIPADYRQSFTKYAAQGYRVIAIASKQLSEIPTGDKATMRPLIESGLSFLGLIVLENKVKSETPKTLSKLHAAKVRCVMVTGDNPVTAVTVAKECGLVEANTRVYVSSFNASTSTISWTDSSDPNAHLDPITLIPALQSSPHRYELAVGGDVFRYLSEQQDSAQPNSFFHRVVLATAVFARMTPDQKAQLLVTLQSMTLYCGMCGDGANDCGALKSAHMGVSLSETEASIAAPFTYQRPNIECVPILLSEGRSSLATSFSLFKYMAMYSMIQFTAVILTYFKASVLGNWQYLYQDLFVVFPLTVLMGATRATPQLSIKRPSGDLLSPVNLANVLTHMLICLSFQVAIFSLTSQYQSPYIDYSLNPDFNNDMHTYETTSLFVFSNFQYIIMAVLFAGGQPWKLPVYTNIRFTFWLIICFIISLLLLFTQTDPNKTFFTADNLQLNSHWQGIIFGFVCINALCNILWEYLFFPLVVKTYKQIRKQSFAQHIGTVYGHIKPIDGRMAKEYHRLRGRFELAWTGQTPDDYFAMPTP